MVLSLSQPILRNPLADFSAPDFDVVKSYWAGAAARREFRSVLDQLQMRARAKGEPFEWSERKGWFQSDFAVRALPRDHDEICRLGERYNATID